MCIQINSNAKRSLRAHLIFSPLTLRWRALLRSLICVMLWSWGVSVAPTTPLSSANPGPATSVHFPSAAAIHDAARAALPGEHIFVLEHPLLPDS